MEGVKFSNQIFIKEISLNRRKLNKSSKTGNIWGKPKQATNRQECPLPVREREEIQEMLRRSAKLAATFINPLTDFRHPL
jgi:hypothetical protein